MNSVRVVTAVDYFVVVVVLVFVLGVAVVVVIVDVVFVDVNIDPSVCPFFFAYRYDT